MRDEQSSVSEQYFRTRGMQLHPGFLKKDTSEGKIVIAGHIT